MHIRCPVCDFTREVNLEKIPPTAEFATCPKCRHRFRFRALDLDAIKQPGPPTPDPKHIDVWEAVDSLRDKWLHDVENGEADGGRTAPEPGEEYAAHSRDDVAIPWENPRHLGYWPSFLKTTFWALAHPVSFFATLSRRPALLPALAYYLLLGLVQHVCNILWTYAVSGLLREQLVARLGEEAFSQLIEAPLDPALLVPNLLTVPFILAIQLFVVAMIIHVIIRIMEPRVADFALAFKVVAYSAAGLVVTVLPIIGALLGPAYYLALLLIGCRSAFALSWPKTFIAMIPLYGFMFLLMSAQYAQIMSI